jgi:hypothetical protein
MLNAIKLAALSAMEAGNPVAVMFGEVTKTNPLEVNVDQRFTIDADFLVQTAATAELKVTIGGTEYIIRPELQVGDRVVLLRIQGGQKYLILDKVVSG